MYNEINVFIPYVENEDVHFLNEGKITQFFECNYKGKNYTAIKINIHDYTHYNIKIVDENRIYHPNVIKFEMLTAPIFLELVSDLHSYLEKNSQWDSKNFVAYFEPSICSLYDIYYNNYRKDLVSNFDTKLRIIKTICSTLEDLSSKNIYPKICSSTIIFTNDGNVKILPLDVFKHFGSHVNKGRLNYYSNIESEMLRYNSPEWISDGIINLEKSLVYSFGVLTNEILSEKLPYSKSVGLLLMGKRFGNPYLTPDLFQNESQNESQNGSQSKSLSELIKMCWVPNPDERPNFNNLMEILEKIN